MLFPCFDLFLLHCFKERAFHRVFGEGSFLVLLLLSVDVRGMIGKICSYLGEEVMVSITNGSVGEVFYVTYLDNDSLQVGLFSKLEARCLRFMTNGVFTGISGVPSVFGGLFAVDVLSVVNSGNCFDCAFYENGVYQSFSVPETIDGRSVIDLISHGPVPMFSGTRQLGCRDLANIPGAMSPASVDALQVKQYLFAYPKGKFPFQELRKLLKVV